MPESLPVIGRRVLSGPAILRASVLLLIAGGLAALVQFWLPSPPAGPPAESPRPAAGDANPPPVRQILPTSETARPAPSPPSAAASPGPSTSQASALPQAAGPPRAELAPPALRSGAPAGSTTAATGPVDPTPLRLPSGATAAPPSPPPVSVRQAEAEVAEARATEGPAAIALVDLNSATVADLNRLRGGGSIGRAIVAKRPYAAVSDLLTKRVLSRSTFERIREQVTVR